MNLRYKQSGLTLLEVMMALTVLIVAIASATYFITSQMRAKAAAAAGAQMKTVAQAVDQYIQVNYTTLVTSTAGGAHVTLPITTLISENYLPPQTQTLNAWGQAYDIVINQPATKALQGVIITTGGPAYGSRFENSVVPQAAAVIGDAGGYTPTGTVAGETPSTIQGAFGGWKLPIADVPGLTSPGAGHLAARVYFSPYSNLNSTQYLYRYAQTNSDLNAMHTAIEMHGNNINHAGELNGASILLGNGSTSGQGSCTDCTVSSNSGAGTHTLIQTNTGWDPSSIYIGGSSNDDRVIAGSPNNTSEALGATGDVTAGTNPTTGAATFKLSKSLQFHGTVTIGTNGEFTGVAVPSCSAYSGETAEILAVPQGYYVTDASGNLIPSYWYWVDTTLSGSTWSGTVYTYVPSEGGWKPVSGGNAQVFTGCG